MKYTKLLLIVIFLFPFLSSCSSKYKSYDDKTVKYISDDIFRKIKSGNFKEVEGYIDYLVKEKPYSKNGTRLLEEIYWTLSYKRNMLEHYNKWCSSEHPHHAAYILKGLYHKTSAWLERGSGYAYTVSDEGSKLFKKNLELAKDDLEKAYSLNPNDPNNASSMITVYMGLRYEEEDMEKWFQRAVTADPVAYNAYSAKLQFLNPKWRGTLEKHLQFAEYCYQNAPPQSVIYKIMLDWFVEYSKKVGDVKKFFRDPQVNNRLNEIYKRVLIDFPYSIVIRRDFAYVQYKLGKIDEAIRLQTEALEIDPNDTYVLLSRGNIYFDNKGDFDKAEADYKKIIENNPYYTKAKADAYFRLGEISSKRDGNYKKAIEYQDKAIGLNPNEILFFLMRGYNKIMGNRDFESALEDFNEAEKIDSHHVYANHYKSMCLQELRRFDEAIANYRKTLEFIEIEEAKGDAGKINEKQAKSLKFQINNYIRLCKEKRTLTNN